MVPWQLKIDLTVETKGNATDLFVSIPAAATGADLHRLLATKLERRLPTLVVERTGEPITDTVVLERLELRSGDRLTDGGGHRANTTAARLRIIDGPTAGETIEVERSDVLGRAHPLLDHSSISREHCLVELTPSGVAVQDRGSTNGTFLNGRQIVAHTRQELHLGDRLELGSIVMELTAIPSVVAGHRPTLTYNRGHLEFSGQARQLAPRPPVRFTAPVPPEEPPKRRFPYAAAVVPLVLGAAMAYLFGPLFALFMAMSPILLAFNVIDDRRSGRRDYETKCAEFDRQLRATALAVGDTRDQLAAWHRQQAPDLPQLRLWTRTRAKELWSRGRRDQDFLAVSPGTCDQPSGIEVEVPMGGAAELRQRSEQMADSAAVLANSPVTIDLSTTSVISLDGSSALCLGVARALVAQLAVLRSYRDLRIALLTPDREADWGWTKWLPHARVDVESQAKLIANSDEHTREVFAQLEGQLTDRLRYLDDHAGATPGSVGPHTLVVVHAPVNVNHQNLAAFVEQAPRAGFSVVWVTDAGGAHHPDAQVVIDPGYRDGVPGEGIDVRFRDGTSHYGVDPRVLDPTDAVELARSLAPLVDVRARSGVGELPASIALHDLMSEERLDAGGIRHSWRTPAKGLSAVIGMAKDGPLSLDIKRQGPHGLVAGTTGAGKSEFLQTLVASLAASYSPRDLNFILIDYKGGSAFRDCEGLAHVIGFVTNLDDHLASRALISLNAELKRRMRIFDQYAISDLDEMKARYPADAPPSVVIIIDEFAALKTEVPDFVDGLVELVAQQGRSLGVHMILATQKPGGIITPQIDSNTNVRIALRVADEADSTEMIRSQLAAEISEQTPGRGYVRIGQRTTAFQSAYVGGRSENLAYDDTKLVTTFRWDGTGQHQVVRREPTGGDHAPTDLARLVASVNRAWNALGSPALHQPWLPALPTEIAFGPLLVSASPSATPIAQIGVADHPDRQSQEPYSIDLVRAGNVAVFGLAGSGKTTFVRTLFGALNAQMEPGSVTLYGIDYAGGLSSIDPLPAVGDVIPGNDMERIQLLVQQLQTEVVARRELLTTHRAGSLAELRSNLDQAPPFIVVAVNGIGPLWSALEGLGLGRHADRFERLLSDGPGVGIHFVLTADQRNAVPPSCNGSIGTRLVQRMASRDDYHAFGILKTPDPALMTPGRTLVADGPEFQVAAFAHTGVADGFSGRGQAAAIARFATALTNRGYGFRADPIRTLPRSVDLAELPAPTAPARIPIGLSPTREPVVLDLATNQTFLIAGRNGSGRSTALATLARCLVPVTDDRRLMVTLRSSPLATADLDATIIDHDVGAALGAVREEVDKRLESGWDSHLFVGIDDVEAFFDDYGHKDVFDGLVNNARAAGLILAVTAVANRTSQNFDSWMRTIRSNGYGLILQPDGDREEDVFDVRFPRGVSADFPPGRGYLVNRNQADIVHIAS